MKFFYLGLLITFIELIKNPSYKFWEHEFVHCAPEIQKLFESVARSCMVRIYLYCFTIAIVDQLLIWSYFHSIYICYHYLQVHTPMSAGVQPMPVEEAQRIEAPEQK